MGTDAIKFRLNFQVIIGLEISSRVSSWHGSDVVCEEGDYSCCSSQQIRRDITEVRYQTGGDKLVSIELELESGTVVGA